MSALAVGERDRLAACEGVIDRGLATFVQVGEALVEIRESRLYRDAHATFEAYCRQRWGFSKVRATQLITAAEAVTVVTTGDTPAPRSERVARELVPLRSDPDRLREAWERTVEEHGPEPTAKQVRQHVRPDAAGPPSGFERASAQITADIERRTALTSHFWAAMKSVYRIKSSLDPALEELGRQDRKATQEIAQDCAAAIDLFAELRAAAERQLSTLEVVR